MKWPELLRKIAGKPVFSAGYFLAGDVDPASLLAGKLHAVLTRPYVKGRDVFDLIWYLSDRDWPAPNLELLNNALGQAGWRGPALAARNWRGAVADRVAQADWTKVLPDVRPFLECERDVELLTRANLLRLLQ